MSYVIIVDTEYTTWPGALESDWSDPGQHKEIVQIAAVKVDTRNDYKEVAHFDMLVKPKINATLSQLFCELTGISQQQVDKQGQAFGAALKGFYQFCEDGKLPVICMNADEMVFRKNCAINNVAFPFVHSFYRLRPFLEQQGVDMTCHSSGTLHTLTQTPIKMPGQVHYALHDVRSMAVYLNHVIKNGTLHSIKSLTNIPPLSDPRATKRCPQ